MAAAPCVGRENVKIAKMVPAPCVGPFYVHFGGPSALRSFSEVETSINICAAHRHPETLKSPNPSQRVSRREPLYVND